MKRFEFSLQRVLDVKETEEKIIQRDLALAQCEHRIAMELQDEFEHRIQRELSQMNEVGRKTTTSGEMLLHQHYLNSLRDALEQQRKVVAELARKVDEAREKLLEKTKEKKSLEQLRENQFDDYTRERRKAEQAFADETAAQTGKFNFAGGRS
jgi:flagellar protein FliJ